MIQNPWLRQIEVSVYPGNESGPSSPNPEPLFKIKSDGTQNTLRVTFGIITHMVSTSVLSTVRIYNLKRETREALNFRWRTIEIKAGWLNVHGDSLPVLVKGTIMAATHAREGADIITTVNIVILGQEADTTFQWDSGTTLKTCITDIASAIPKVKVDPKLIQVPDGTISARGINEVGRPTEILKTWGKRYGFSSHVGTDGTFRALSDGQYMDELGIEISNKNGFLLRVEPNLEGVWQNSSGVTIVSFLNPNIQPGRPLIITSSLTDKLNSTKELPYIPHEISHIGDTHSSQWETHMTCFWFKDDNTYRQYTPNT